MFPDNLRKLVIQKRKLGLSYVEIGTIFNLSKSTVQSLINYKPIIHKRKSGPKYKVDKFTSLNIKKYINNSNENGLKVNCNGILDNLNLGVSRRTLNNWLLQREYSYVKKVQKMQLTKDHRLKRIKAVSSWIHTNIDFNCTVFTDEKKFNLDGPDNW